MLRTVEWVHQRIAGNGCCGTAGSYGESVTPPEIWVLELSRTGSKRVMLMALALISTERMFCCLVGCEVNGVGRSWSCCQLARPEMSKPEMCIPAPRTTLESPFHNDLNPSTLETVTSALAMELVYVAVGPGLMTCIRVCISRQHATQCTIADPSSWVAYLEHVDGVHDRVFLMQFLAKVDLTRRLRMHTAIPANAPASMFAPSEKLGGSAS